MAVLDRPDLQTFIDSQWADNTSEAITPEVDRGVGTSINDSALNRKGDPYTRNGGTTTGTATAYILTIANSYPQVNTSDIFITFKAHLTNTGTTPTMNVNGNGAITMKTAAGAALAIGDLVINQYYGIVFDGTDFLVNIGIDAVLTVNNQADNRLITATATTDTLNAEEELTWDGNVLAVNGSVSTGRTVTLKGTGGAANAAGGLNLNTAAGGGLDIFAASTDANPVWTFATFSNEQLAFVIGASESFRVDSTGDIIVAAGNDIILTGVTSGTVTLGVPAEAGTTTFTLPGDDGTSGYVLTTDGSGVTNWVNAAVGSQTSFTPVVADAATGGNTGSGSFQGFFVPIGAGLVFISIKLVNINTAGMTGSNSIFIRDLPFDSNANPSGTGQPLTLVNQVMAQQQHSARISPSTDYINLFDSAGAIAIVSDISSGSSDILLEGIYMI